MRLGVDSNLRGFDTTRSTVLTRPSRYRRGAELCLPAQRWCRPRGSICPFLSQEQFRLIAAHRLGPWRTGPLLGFDDHGLVILPRSLPRARRSMKSCRRAARGAGVARDVDRDRPPERAGVDPGRTLGARCPEHRSRNDPGDDPLSRPTQPLSTLSRAKCARSRTMCSVCPPRRASWGSADAPVLFDDTRTRAVDRRPCSCSGRTAKTGIVPVEHARREAAAPARGSHHRVPRRAYFHNAAAASLCLRRGSLGRGRGRGPCSARDLVEQSRSTGKRQREHERRGAAAT